jgi:hypothetical protein
LYRYTATPPELRDAASAADAGLSSWTGTVGGSACQYPTPQIAFTAMDTCKEIFKFIGSQSSFHSLFEETCLDEDAVARFKRMESNVPQGGAVQVQSIWFQPLRHTCDVLVSKCSF